jgi:hypothetical protein
MFDIVGNQLRAAGCILTQCDDSGSETQLARQPTSISPGSMRILELDLLVEATESGRAVRQAACQVAGAIEAAIAEGLR